jgi:NADH dehydrogenase
LTRTLGVETDKAGRIRVDDMLALPTDGAVYAIGDVAAVVERGRPVPGIAQAAIQQGQHVGRAIAARIEGRPPPQPFSYADRGTMAVVGKNFALLQRGSLGISGFATWWLWALIHVAYLPQLQNRLRVQLQWLWSYFSGQRGARLIAECPAQAPALHELAAAAVRPLAPDRRVPTDPLLHGETA